jgi:hypothetical protein
MAPLTAWLPPPIKTLISLSRSWDRLHRDSLNYWAPSRGHGCDALVQLGKTPGYVR